MGYRYVVYSVITGFGSSFWGDDAMGGAQFLCKAFICQLQKGIYRRDSFEKFNNVYSKSNIYGRMGIENEEIRNHKWEEKERGYKLEQIKGLKVKHLKERVHSNTHQ